MTDETVETCPFCKRTNFSHRVRNTAHERHDDPDDPYYCRDCRRSFDETEEWPQQRDPTPSADTLAGKLARMDSDELGEPTTDGDDSWRDHYAREPADG